MEHEASGHRSAKEKVVEEFNAYWVITLYLALFFGALTVYRRMILAEFGVTYLHYGFAVIEALIIAKVILIGKLFGFSKWFEDKPLIVSVLYKSILFGVFVFLFGILEHVVEGWFHKKDWASIVHGMTELGKYELLGRMIMLIVAFVPFFAFWEIGRVLGMQKLAAMFFSKREVVSGAQRPVS